MSPVNAQCQWRLHDACSLSTLLKVWLFRCVVYCSCTWLCFLSASSPIVMRALCLCLSVCLSVCVCLFWWSTKTAEHTAMADMLTITDRSIERLELIGFAWETNAEKLQHLLLTGSLFDLACFKLYLLCLSVCLSVCLSDEVQKRQNTQLWQTCWQLQTDL